MPKQTLDGFLTAKPAKKPRLTGPVWSGPSVPIDLDGLPSPPLANSAVQLVAEGDEAAETPSSPPSAHPTYPFPIPALPLFLHHNLEPAKPGKVINDKPDLDLLVYEPYMARSDAKVYGEHIRSQLPFYRVTYSLNRYGKPTTINTPRYTTVFGVDDTSRFTPSGDLVEASSGVSIKPNKYKCKPRPIPSCLDALRKSVEKHTNTTYNFALVNYYATGSDSISWHSDDEHFLEPEPAIASFAFIGVRDFFLKHKPPKKGSEEEIKTKDVQDKPLKFVMQPGTLILMRGTTQRCWLHSVPKRADGGGGRINITFRKNMTVGGTENYYRYNIGDGPVYKWDKETREMRLWKVE